jgi:hypothetical protein
VAIKVNERGSIDFTHVLIVAQIPSVSGFRPERRAAHHINNAVEVYLAVGQLHGSRLRGRRFLIRLISRRLELVAPFAFHGRDEQVM